MRGGLQKGKVRIMTFWSEILDSLDVRRKFRDRGMSCSSHNILDPSDVESTENIEKIVEFFDVFLVDATNGGFSAIEPLAGLIKREQRPPVVAILPGGAPSDITRSVEMGVDAYVTDDGGSEHLDALVVLLGRMAARQARELARKGTEIWIGRLERERDALLRSSLTLVTFHSLDTRVAWSNVIGPGDGEGTDDKLAGRFCNEIWTRGGDTVSGCPISRSLESGKPEEEMVESLEGHRMLQRVHPVRNSENELVGVIASTLDLTLLDLPGKSSQG